MRNWELRWKNVIQIIEYRNFIEGDLVLGQLEYWLLTGDTWCLSVKFLVYS